VRFRGANAQEYARRQLHELAELLGFDTSAGGGAGVAETAEASTDRPAGAPAE
jgi:hypothetical protein